MYHFISQDAFHGFQSSDRPKRTTSIFSIGCIRSFIHAELFQIEFLHYAERQSTHWQQHAHKTTTVVNNIYEWAVPHAKSRLPLLLLSKHFRVDAMSRLGINIFSRDFLSWKTSAIFYVHICVLNTFGKFDSLFLKRPTNNMDMANAVDITGSALLTSGIRSFALWIEEGKKNGVNRLCTSQNTTITGWTLKCLQLKYAAYVWKYTWAIEGYEWKYVMQLLTYNRRYIYISMWMYLNDIVR